MLRRIEGKLPIQQTPVNSPVNHNPVSNSSRGNSSRGNNSPANNNQVNSSPGNNNPVSNNPGVESRSHDSVNRGGRRRRKGRNNPIRVETIPTGKIPRKTIRPAGNLR